jgi:hypothetical protein
MESSGHIAHVNSETVKKNWVTDHYEIAPETASRSDALIRQRTQPLLTQEQSRKTESLPTQKSSRKLFPEIRHGFVSPHSPVDSEKVKENWVADHWELAPLTTFTSDEGFVIPHSPCWLINSQGKLSRCPLTNSPRNCFHRWRMNSSAHTARVDSWIVKVNWVAAHSKITSETASRDDAWNPQRT